MNEKWRQRGEGGETDWCLFLNHDSLFFTGTKQRNKRKTMKEKFSLVFNVLSYSQDTMNFPYCSLSQKVNFPLRVDQVMNGFRFVSE